MPNNSNRWIACLLPLALLLSGTACTDRSGNESPKPAPPAAAPVIDSAKPTAEPAPAGTDADPAPARSAGWLLALDTEGLRVFNSNTGASRLIAFGDDAMQSLQALGGVLGEPPPAPVQNEDCQVGFARFSNGLTVWSSRSRFTGWSVTPDSSPLATASGVMIGSSRAELESAYDAKIMESSLGTEFLAGSLAGLLDSSRPDAKISNLWAGETCIAR